MQQRIYVIKSKWDDTFVNIRVKKGRGPRDITVMNSSKKRELIEQAKELYFGKSGTMLTRMYWWLPFEKYILDDEIIVGKLYEQTCFSN